MTKRQGEVLVLRVRKTSEPEAARQLGRPRQVENEPMNLKGVRNEVMDLRTRCGLRSKFGNDCERGRGETEGDVNEKGGNGGVLGNSSSVKLWLMPRSFPPESLSGERWR